MKLMKLLVIKDRVYGNIVIENPLITDLIGSKPMQRLKNIHQSGATFYLEPERNITRFEHCIGVWYLLKRYGAGTEEQAVGLLHDVPHTAFSHVFDVVFPNEGYNFHEKFEEKMISESEIPEILKKYGIEWKKILYKNNFPLLEADLPDLSADRIDYFLRDTRIDPIFPDSLVWQFLEGLFVENGRFYFKDSSLACLYAMLFISAGRILWVDPNSHGSHYLLADILKRAINLKLLSENDFFKTDAEVMKILYKTDDPDMQQKLKKLSPVTEFEYADRTKAEYFGPNKPRVVDPLVKKGGRLVRISELVYGLTGFFNQFKNDYRMIGVKETA